MGNTFVRFECGMEDRFTENLGPFTWVQFTYDLVRVSRTDDDNGEVELAVFKDGWWEYDGQRFSDVIIGAASDGKERATAALPELLGALDAIRQELDGTFVAGDGSHAEAAHGRALAALSAAAATAATERPDITKSLAYLREHGLTIGHCIRALAVPEDDPYVQAARKLIAGGDDMEIDDATTTSVGEDGAWVLNWLWVSNEEAGILGAPELLETVLDAAREGLPSASADAQASLRIQADWLEDLIVNFADELDDLAACQAAADPEPLIWTDEDGRSVPIVPSAAIAALIDCAGARLNAAHARQAREYLNRNGPRLDAALKTMATPA